MYDKQGNVVDRREMLKVKFNSLMAEARIIRRAEEKAHGAIYLELRAHRRGIVRSEARATSLALGFIRGKTLDQMEPTRKSEAPMDRVNALLKKYGAPFLTEVKAAA